MVHVPGNAYAADVALTVAMRGGRVESIHRGTFVVAEPSGRIVLAAGEPRQRTYMRSSAKPFQSMALILTGAAEALGLSPQDLAIASASHSGEPEHVYAVLHLLARAGVDSTALRCGTHPPLDASEARRLAKEGESPTALHNNCSGKHAGMLAACSFMEWPIDSYTDPAHPLQQLNLQTVAAFTGHPVEEIGIAIDGCGVPVFYVSVLGIARAFARLATGNELEDRYGVAATRIREAMMSFPHLVGGTGRLDTQLMTAGSGAIVCKGGAQGGEGIGLIPSGLGLGMKISDGSSSSIGLISFRVLSAIGALDAPMKEALSEYDDAPIRNHAGTVVGAVKTAFDIRGWER